MNQEELIESINGIINTYFVRTVLDRPDMAKNAKKDLLELFNQNTQQVREEDIKIVRKNKYKYKCRFGCTHKNSKDIDNILDKLSNKNTNE